MARARESGLLRVGQGRTTQKVLKNLCLKAKALTVLYVRVWGLKRTCFANTESDCTPGGTYAGDSSRLRENNLKGFQNLCLQARARI